MENILAVLDQPMAAGAVLEVAGALAARLSAALAVLAPLPDQDPDFLPTAEVMTPARKAAWEKEVAERRTRFEAAFTAWRARAPGGTTLKMPRGNPTALLHEAAAKADLLIQAAPPAGAEAHALLHEALFAAKAPVLLVPHGAGPSIGRHVAIAWEASQAVKAAIDAAGPILERAEAVTILIGHEGEAGEAALPSGLAESLAASGVRLDSATFDLAGRRIGTALAEEAARVGADLLVMGAYTHPMFMERMFGGATRALIEAGMIPLLLHH